MPKTTDAKKLWDLIKKQQIGMLATKNAEGVISSRPMALSQDDFDGYLWFFAEAASHKVDEIQHHREVNVSFIDGEKSQFVSVSGKAQVVRDKEKAKLLWRPFLRAWFPKGVESPEIVLLRVKVESAEYWESASSSAVNISVTVETPKIEPPRNKKLNLSQ